MSYDPTAGNPSVAMSTAKSAANNTGSTIPIFMPVKITATGIQTVNPSVEADIDAFAGVTASAITNGSNGFIVSSGLIQNTGLSYPAGTALWLSKSGGVTNVKPDIGVGGFVSGDWVVKLGVTLLNDSSPLLIDVIVFIEVKGQL